MTSKLSQNKMKFSDLKKGQIFTDPEGKQVILICSNESYSRDLIPVFFCNSLTNRYVFSQDGHTSTLRQFFVNISNFERKTK